MKFPFPKVGYIMDILHSSLEGTWCVVGLFWRKVFLKGQTVCETKNKRLISLKDINDLYVGASGHATPKKLPKNWYLLPTKRANKKTTNNLCHLILTRHRLVSRRQLPTHKPHYTWIKWHLWGNFFRWTHEVSFWKYSAVNWSGPGAVWNVDEIYLWGENMIIYLVKKRGQGAIFHF